jgi:alpha-mannosidase
MTEADLDVSLRDFDAYHPQATHQPFTDIGRHTIRLALAASREDAPRREQPAQLADVLFTPIHCYKGSPRSAGLADLGGGDSLVAAWAKPEQDGWTLRLSETAGRHGEVHLTTADGVAMEQVNLKGNPTQPINGDTLPFKPHQLLSLRMKRC